MPTFSSIRKAHGLKERGHGICGNAGTWGWQARARSRALLATPGGKWSSAARAGTARPCLPSRPLLPLIAALMLGLYALPSFLKKSIDHGRGTASSARHHSRGRLAQDDRAARQGRKRKRGAYDITADSATQAASNPDVMYLEVVRER